MSFRDTLDSLLEGIPYELLGGDPHVHLDAVLAVAKAKKERTYPDVANVHEQIKSIPYQFGLEENGLTIASRLYQNAARILQRVSPRSIGDVDEEDGTIKIDSDLEFAPADNLNKLTPQGKEVLGGLFYLAGIGNLIKSMDNYIDMDDVNYGMENLERAQALLPNEMSVAEAIKKGHQIKAVAMLEGKPVDTGSKCFIATAAMGSPLAQEVLILSRFRDEVLVKKFIGRRFIQSYYAVSPRIADLISRNVRLQQITARYFIKPLSKVIAKLVN